MTATKMCQEMATRIAGCWCSGILSTAAGSGATGIFLGCWASLLFSPSPQSVAGQDDGFIALSRLVVLGRPAASWRLVVLTDWQEASVISRHGLSAYGAGDPRTQPGPAGAKNANTTAAEVGK